MSKWILGVLVVAMPCIALAAGKHSDAGGNSAKFDQMFKAVDANGDGLISKQEAELKAPAMAENFAAIDTNHDGGLSKNEIKAFTAALEKKRREFSQQLENADKDKNGMLSREEAAALPYLSEHFDEIDSNLDGQLVIKEIADYLRIQVNAKAAAAAVSAPTPAAAVVPAPPATLAPAVAK